MIRFLIFFFFLSAFACKQGSSSSLNNMQTDTLNVTSMMTSDALLYGAVSLSTPIDSVKDDDLFLRIQGSWKIKDEGDDSFTISDSLYSNADDPTSFYKIIVSKEVEVGGKQVKAVEAEGLLQILDPTQIRTYYIISLTKKEINLMSYDNGEVVAYRRVKN